MALILKELKYSRITPIEDVTLKRLIPRFKLTYCLSCLLVITQLSHATEFSISGIKDDLAKNVAARIDILKKQNRLITNARLKQNIIQAMAPFGYYSPKILINHNQIRIKKGTPTHIKSINIKIEGPGENIIKQHFKNNHLKANHIFQSEALDDTKQALLNIAEQNGYLSAQIIKSEAVVNKDSHQATIHIQFSTGDLYYFGAIRFAKTTAYNPLFLKRYLNFHQGQPFSTNKLLKLNAKFNDSGYFNKVSVKPKIDKNIHVPVNIYLHDKPSQNYIAGLGYVTDTGVRARLGWHWLRVNNFGHTFQALYVGSQKQNTLQAEYVIPGKNPSTDQYIFSSKIFQLRYPVGSSHAQQFTAASIFKKNSRLYTLSLNLLEESFNFTGFDKLTRKVLYPNLKMEYKKVSSAIFSKQGFVIYSNLKFADKFIYSDLNLAQIEVSLKAAFWLPSHTRIMLKNHLGFTKTNNINQLPLSLQLLAGGADSIRGYHYQSIGPGTIVRTHSIEIQQETFDDWFLTAFYDMGDVYRPSAKKWRHGVGGGIMWVSPVGPIRLSLAKALNDKGQPLRVIFNIGPDL